MLALIAALSLLAVGVVPAAQAASGMLPFTVTNNSGLDGPTYVYVMARDQASGVQGWVDGVGTWHAFNLPAQLEEGTSPPAAPDTAIPGPTSGRTTTLHLRSGLIAGRIYMSFDNKLSFFLTPEGVVEPAGWVETDPNHDTLFDWVEFARDGSRFFINTTMVDMFSVPISVSVVHGDGHRETQGRLVTNGRQRIFSDLKSYGWGGLIQYREDGSLPLRAIAPIHGVEGGTIPADYFADYVDEAWTYYSTTPLTVTTALGDFTGKVSNGKWVFRNSAGAVVGTFSKFSTTEILACEGNTQPLGQPDHHAALAIGARLCAAFNRGTLSTPDRKGSDVQATHDAASFYQPGIASNLYSKAMHRSEANGNAYGFAFDDVAEFSPSINSENPSVGNMTVGPFSGGAGGGTSGEPLTASVESMFGHWSYGGYSDDPVNVATGNFTQSEPVLDFAVPWTPSLSLTYNSRDGRTGPFGPGWSSSLTESVSENEDGSASIVWPDGSTVVYPTNEDGTYAKPPGVDAKLTRSSTGWQVTRPDGSAEAFDNAGRVLSFRNAEGKTVTVTRVWSGNAVTLSNADGYSLDLAYGGNGRLTGVTSSDGRTAALNYDSAGRLAGISAPGGGTRSFTYNADGYLEQNTDADGLVVVTNRYDGDGRVLEQSRPGQPTEVFAYDEEHGTAQITTSAGELVMAYSFDEAGRLTEMAAGDGTTTTRDYDAQGRVTESTDRAGTTTTTTWTDDGQVASVTSDGATSSYAYDAQSRPTAVTSATGETVTYTYEGSTRVPTRAALPDGSQVSFDTDGGLLTSVTDADGKISTYTYDTHHNLASVTSPTGAVTRYERDGAGRITATTAADGGVTRTEYDDAGRVASVTDATGAATRTTYTAAGRVKAVTDPDGRRTTYTYDDAGRQATSTAPDGGITQFAYDERGDLVKTVDAEGIATTFTRDLFGRVTISERDGVRTTFTYDANGRPMAAATGGQSTTVQYDDAGRVIASTDANGAMTRFAYDANGHLTRTTAPDGTVTTSTFDPMGNEISRTDAIGRKSTATYSSAGLLTSTTDPMGYTTRYAHDDDGRVTSVTTPGDHTWNYGYDAAGRPSSITSPTGLTTVYEYDGVGRPTTVTSPGTGEVTTTYTAAGRAQSTTDTSGAEVTYTYDEAGRMASSTDALGGRTAYEYDGVGRLITRTDPRGGATRFTYTDSDRVATVTDPLGRTTSYVYDSRGNVTSAKDPDGKITAFTYDRVGRLVGRTDPSGAEVGWTYDVNGRRSSMTDATGTTRYTYDPVGQLTSLTPPGDGQPYTFTYDGKGRVATTTSPDGTIVTYGRDADGNLAAVTDNRGSYLAYSVDADGKVTREGSSAGAVRTFAYRDGLLSRYTEQLGAQAPTVATEIERGPTGDITAMATDGARTVYGYDVGGQLTSVDGPGGADRSYTYDAAGNRLTRTGDGPDETYKYDAAHQLTSIERDGDPFAALSYDGAGRLTSRSATAGPSLALTYDGTGNPTRIESSDGDGNSTVARLSRDGDGNPVSIGWTRTGTNAGTGTTALGWLTTDGLPAVATLTTDATTTNLYRGASGTLLQSQTATAVTDVSRDPLGSIRAGAPDLAAASGYDEYGLADLEPDPDAPVVGFGYRGQLTVAGIALMTARAYEPTTGRFVATDPLPPVPGSVGVSPYSYANNDPLDLIDPLGLRSVSDSAFSNAAWGFFDGITFGLTRHMRQGGWLGLTDNVNYASGAYKGGVVSGSVTGIVVTTAISGGTLTVVAAGAYGGAVTSYAMPAVFQERQASWGELALGAAAGGAAGGAGLLAGRAAASTEFSAGANTATHAFPIGPASEKVTTVLNRVDAKGSPPAGYKGAKEFQNSQGRLPDTMGVTYREWDVNPYVKGVDRGAERLVTGSDGSAYFTSDHYDSFMLVRGPTG